jgi:hypothetical protein
VTHRKPRAARSDEKHPAKEAGNCKAKKSVLARRTIATERIAYQKGISRKEIVTGLAEAGIPSGNVKFD